MFEETPVFNSSFEKIRRFLNIDYRAITSDKSLAVEALKIAPDRIKIASYKLFEFAKRHNADLLLFSSNSGGKFGVKSDWNFALHFLQADKEKDLNVIRQKLIDEVTPYSINIINLNKSPLWFKLLVKGTYIRLLGHTDEARLFSTAD